MTNYRLKTLVSCPVDKSDGVPIPFVGLEDIGSGTGSLATSKLSTKAALDSILYCPNDVLFSKLRPYLAKSFIARSEGSGTSELLVLRSRGSIEPRFLLYSTLSAPWIEWAKTTSYGTKMPRTSWEAMSEYRLDLPPLDEQRRIADFLDAETARIDQLDQSRNKQLMLLDERTEAWRSKLFMGSKSGVWVRVKHLLRAKPRYGVLVPEFVDDGTPMIRVGDLVDLSESTKLPKIPRSLSLQYARTITIQGDILVAVVGATIGKVAMVTEGVAGSNVNRAIAVLRPHQTYSPTLFASWVGGREFKEQAHLATSADSAQPTLGMEDLANFSLRWPTDRAEQRQMASLVQEYQLEVSTTRKTVSRQLEVLAERRQALITAAVTGAITV
jgi:type I restriction enzyme, S subunit